MGKRRGLANFLAIAFGWSWLVWGVRLVLQARGVELGFWKELFSIAATMGPGVSALMLSRMESKRSAKELWRRGWHIASGLRWLYWGLAGVVAIGLFAAGVSAVIEPIPWQYALPLAMAVPIGASMYLFGALPEEYGWRGYALPRLLKRFSPSIATLVLGLIWGVWHIPLHYIAGTTQSAMPVYQVILANTAIAFQLTWIYQRTEGSVMAPALLHAMGNLTLASLPFWVTDSGRWIYFGIIGALAVVMAVSHGFLSLQLSPED